MTLWPNVKQFIERYIEDIENEDMAFVFSESLVWLNDVEFNQLYDIFQELPLEYDIDEFINDLIHEICEDIIKENDGNYICIEDEWDDQASNHLNNKDRIIYEFDDFDFDIKNGKHWCTVYR